MTSLKMVARDGKNVTAATIINRGNTVDSIFFMDTICEIPAILKLRSDSGQSARHVQADADARSLCV
jgi:hypothetical protein